MLSKQPSNPNIIKKTGVPAASVLLQQRLSLVSKLCVDVSDLGNHIQSVQHTISACLEHNNTQIALMQVATYSVFADEVWTRTGLPPFSPSPPPSPAPPSHPSSPTPRSESNLGSTQPVHSQDTSTQHHIIVGSKLLPAASSWTCRHSWCRDKGCDHFVLNVPKESLCL